MSMNYRKIPFYPNLKSNTHCMQASLKSVLKYYFPKKDYSYQYLDKVTNHKKGMWTWNTSALLFLAKLEFEVKNIENFDYKQFAEFGERYMRHICEDEEFEVQKAYSDFEQESRLAKKLISNKSISLIKRGTTMKEIEGLFEKGYLLIATVNPEVFERRKGYGSHSVVITGMTKKQIIFHDPGIPPRESRRVFKKTFIRAAQPYPRVIAIRHSKA